jgi:hypothetical protein
VYFPRRGVVPESREPVPLLKSKIGLEKNGIMKTLPVVLAPSVLSSALQYSLEESELSAAIKIAEMNSCVPPFEKLPLVRAQPSSASS